MRQSDNMNEDETAEFKEAFALFDKDGDGVITPLELGVALRAMGQEPSDEDLKVCGFHARRPHVMPMQHMIDEFDTNGDGVIDFPEVCDSACLCTLAIS